MIRTRPPFADPISLNDLMLATLGGWGGGPVALLEALIDRWEVRA